MAGPTGKIAMVEPGLITEREVIRGNSDMPLELFYLNSSKRYPRVNGIWRSNLRPSARHRKDNPVPEHTA